MRGQSATLRWSVSNASEISAEPAIGTLPANGTRSVYPSANTSYILRATGPGGTVTASASVTVNNPDIPPPPRDPNAGREGQLTLSQRLERDIKDAYFDYDRNDLRPDAIDALTADSVALRAILRDFPSATVAIEGHSDERGSAEYNLGLGDRRAQSAQEFLIQQGIPVERLRLISYGKERPQCTDASEGCWQRNRRVHLVAGMQ
jgi:peptidoglycan-associated lipoprotein